MQCALATRGVFCDVDRAMKTLLQLQLQMMAWHRTVKDDAKFKSVAALIAPGGV
jgi:hypothetical protein